MCFIIEWLKTTNSFFFHKTIQLFEMLSQMSKNLRSYQIERIFTMYSICMNKDKFII